MYVFIYGRRHRSSSFTMFVDVSSDSPLSHYPSTNPIPIHLSGEGSLSTMSPGPCPSDTVDRGLTPTSYMVNNVHTILTVGKTHTVRRLDRDVTGPLHTNPSLESSRFRTSAPVQLKQNPYRSSSRLISVPQSRTSRYFWSRRV